ncbi:PAS domain-containing sensor histidine kinase [Janthinobacterium sp. 17J80-10]|uniref:sensor histidine kinase n=1 Tax=Janthinobacterium sp. 17J80-10 TaxID=2497863 RepID=UPI00100567C8|nr:PAS domain-containing sensor histidine kinase [Janthinobacterium sp. 17J80-10]QAU32733.1 PAS domain-containing sensor histidine kinase [Janthinobacterium sp. 17J80-10]
MLNKQLDSLFTFGIPDRKRVWHWLVPMLLVLLFLSAMLWLPWQAQQMEATERQEKLIADTLWVEQAIRFQLERDEDSIGLIGNEISAGDLSGKRLQDRMTVLRRNNRELSRIIWLDPLGRTVTSTDTGQISISDLSASSRLTAERARATRTPQYSQPAPPPGQNGPMLMDYHVPLHRGQQYLGNLVVQYSVASILEEMVPWWFAQDNEILLADDNDNVIARRAAGGPGRGVYTHSRVLDLPYASVTLRTNSVKSEPTLLPNLLVGTVIALSVGLIWSLIALWRDINRRLAAEGALRRQVAFRTAMENSLMTGLRARDLEGRITYVNPAFCEMVGIPAEELVGKAPPMPYWAPEAMDEYQQRFTQVLAGTVTPQYETIFQRANGERFPVLIFESPLVDDSGKQTGWMGSILDISDREKVEELNRRQQEKLEASARLATMGEIASTLAHELNQPLAAISSYTTGALNMIENSSARGKLLDPEVLKPALEKASTQAQRAGHIIRSVHTFVKRREPSREPLSMQSLIESVMTLVELQARQFFVHLQVQIAPGLPSVLADRVMLEQVLLNLTRNAIEAMQEVAPERRILRIVATLDTDSPQRNVIISVVDQGHGISEEVAERLFSPFFSTKAEGMGMGLKICRTTVEFHGGTLVHVPNPAGGTIFRFTLPAMADATKESRAIEQK